MAVPIRCALIDIDGTLVRMRGAGPRAMETAFHALTGIRGAFDGIRMAGRTDRAIIGSAMERLAAAGRVLPPEEELLPPFLERYLPELAAEAAKPGATVCRGVIATLDALERHDVTLALATGNFAAAAEIKLARFGLWSRFAFGAWGDETRDRSRVVATAVSAVRRVVGAGPEETIVIGDTEADVAAGRAAGARTLAVATGPFSVADLAATNPDLVFPDLVQAVRAEFWSR